MLTSAGRSFLVALVLCLAVVLLSGCDSDAATAKLENDTPQRVEVRLCSDNACKGFDPPRHELDPGGSIEVNVSKWGVPNVYLVQDADGRRVGCLPIVVREPPGTVEVLVSARLPCSDEVPEEWP